MKNIFNYGARTITADIGTAADPAPTKDHAPTADPAKTADLAPISGPRTDRGDNK